MIQDNRADILVDNVVSKSLVGYPDLRPLSSNTKRLSQRSRPSTPTLSEEDDKMSSIAQLGTKDDLVAG